MRSLLVLFLIMASSCSMPVMFSVEVDEEISRGTLTLNGRSARLMKNVDGAYWAKWNGSDADGRIQIIYPDGRTTLCQIGYVTHGMGVQKFVVSARRCQQV